MLESAKTLLEKMTELYPPGEGEQGETRHNLTLNGGKLELTLMFNGKFHPILITENELMMPTELVIDKICFLFDPIKLR